MPHGNLKIVAFTGKSGSGKSTMAQAVLTEYGGTKLSFASPLKELASKVTINGKIDKARDRCLLQDLGSYYRNRDLNYFVDILALKLDETDSDLVVIDDLRFNNEARMLIRRGAHIIKCASPFKPRQFVETEEHESEWGILKGFVDLEVDVLSGNGSATGDVLDYVSRI